MQRLTYDYQDKQIEFLLGGDMMVNATEMAAVYGKRVVDFTRREETKKFIEALSKRAIGEFKGADFSPLIAGFGNLSPDKVVKGANGTPILITIPGNEGGTWMHRWLAIDFAMWLDLDFKIWVMEKIDYLMINFSNKQRELISRKKELLKAKELMLEEQKDNPIVIKLNDINEELKGVANKMAKSTKDQYSIWSNLDR
ncbi:hypothetical protein GCM10027284_08930 [Cyclobacterium sediminis]